MPPLKEATPEYTSFSEERRQVLGFILTYLERRNSLSTDYYKKLVSLNSVFMNDLNILTQSIVKAKSITKKETQSMAKYSEDSSSVYEMIGRLLIESMNTRDQAISRSFTLPDGSLKNLFHGMAIDKQVELEAIDATIASMSNQQHTMCAKLEKLRAEYLSSLKHLSMSFEELKKKALIYDKKNNIIHLAKVSAYEKPLLEFAKKSFVSHKLADSFYDEVCRIQDAFEEIKDKTEHLKNKLYQIEEARAEDMISLLKKSLGSALDAEIILDDIGKQCAFHSNSHLKLLFGENNSSNDSFFALPRSTDSCTLQEISPVTPFTQHGSKDILEKINLILKEEEKRLLISPNAQHLLAIIKDHLSKTEAHADSFYGKSEYEKMRLSSYRNKSASPSTRSLTISMDTSPTSKSLSPAFRSSSAIKTPTSPSIFTIESPLMNDYLPTQPKTNMPTKYVALYNSTAETKDELSFSEGDLFESTSNGNESSDSEWIYLVHLSTGLEGYVPRSYIQPARL